MRDAVDASIENMRYAKLAAILGCLTVLQNLLQRGHLDKTQVCQWAACGGHLKVLQWARENERPWNELTARARRRAATSRCCSGCERTTARGTGGRARARRGAATSRCCSGCERTAARGTRRRARPRAPWRPPRGAEVGAQERLPVERGDMLGCGAAGPPRGAAVGARERLPVERELRVRGGGRPPRGCSGCSERLPVDWRTCATRASWRGHLEVLQWLRERLPVEREDVLGRGGGRPPRGAEVDSKNDCPWNEETCWAAAQRPPRGAASRARNDFPWDENTCSLRRRAATSGRAPVGARERLPVEREDVLGRGARRPPPGAEVGVARTTARGTRRRR